MERVTRHCVGLVLWIALSAAFVAIAGQVVTSNYLACKAAFELLGFEMQPLKTDELIGPLVGAFFPKATLAHLYALALALTVAGAFFLLFHLGFHIYDLVEDRHAYMEAGDERSARVVVRLIVCNGVAMLAFGIPLIVAVGWDINLFRYRSIAGALGIEDPRVAAMTVKAWDLQMRDNRQLYAWSAARWGAWGYLAVTVLACLGLEFAFRKTGDTWAKLIGAIRETFQPGASDGDQLMLDGYDENIAPTYDSDATASDGEAEGSEQLAPAAAGGTNEDSPVRNAATFDALFTPPPTESAPTASAPLLAHPSLSPSEQDPRDVIGSEERVTLTVARANPDMYHVDATTGEVWNRDHWERLHDVASKGDRAEAA